MPMVKVKGTLTFQQTVHMPVNRQTQKFYRTDCML